MVIGPAIMTTDGGSLARHEPLFVPHSNAVRSIPYNKWFPAER